MRPITLMDYRNEGRDWTTDGPPSWTVMELCIPPLEEKTERPSKGPDQPKTKEEAVVLLWPFLRSTAYAEWATKARVRRR